jgi:S-adenosylmethionine hydrolase
MKGVMLDICPSANIVDISHSVQPQNIAEAAFLLRCAYPYFPPGTVHCAVVDPGVGTTRKPIAIRSKRGLLVGPDNGIFTHVALEDELVEQDGSLHAGGAVELVASEYRRAKVSQTFHGRDIFAPAAAHLSLGVPLRNLGPTITEIQLLDLPAPQVTGGAVHGRIIHIDRFGNAISNISGDMLQAAARVAVNGAEIEGLSPSYQQKDIVAIVGSFGLLEIAARNGNASRRMGLHVGDPVEVST